MFCVEIYIHFIINLKNWGGGGGNIIDLRVTLRFDIENGIF